MLEYARWKYILVSAVLALALLLALPTLFGQDLALQILLKNHDPVPAQTQSTIEQFLKERGVHYTKVYIDGGRLMVRFPDVAEQLKGRDAVNDKYSDQFITAQSFAPRTPELLRKLGLRPIPLGL